MTDKEKARAYDEAVKKARCWLNDPQTIQDCNYTIEDAIQNIFPVLAKNEDEMIRKELINWINGKTTYEWSYEWCENKDRWIAYLEKQKEQKSYSLIYDKDLDKAAREYYLSGGADSPIDSTGLVPIVRMAEFGATWMKERMEKEQKPCWNPTEEDVALFNKAITTNASLSPQERAKLDILRMKFKHRPVIEQKEQKPIKMEVYEVGKGTTICGQDYKCKKDYKEGNCWYIKDAIYHCGRDGYLTDQNGVSWSCTPEWFNEYIQSNTEWAEEEKTRFVSGQFIQCKRSFDGFKEGEHYWLEYIGDDMYVGRSDNILNQKFHITPRQLYTLFSQKLEEVQGPPQEEKQVSLNYEPPFNENPSDNEIIEALIKHLKEQDGFLTAINCVSTKAILDWLEKQKDASKAIEAVEKIDKYIDEHLANAHDMKDSNPDKKYYRGWDDALGKMSGILQDVYSEEKQKEQKPDSLIYDKDLDKAAREFYLSGGADSPIDSTGLVPIVRMAEFGATWMKERMEKEQKPADWNEDWREEDIQTRFAFYTYKNEEDDGVLYLSNVFVEEASRNHGFGTKILRAAEKVAETIGATTICLKVRQNSPANAWYRKNGYGYVAFEDGYDWLEKNLEYMKPQPKQEWQIKKGDKVSIHCRKDREKDIIAIYDGKVGKVTHVSDKRYPWGHIDVKLNNGCNNSFHEDELEV